VVKTTVQQLNEYGQSVWLDYISRALLDTGRLRRLIEQGVRGLTSNPSIFDKAVTKSSDYDESIRELKGKQKSTFEIYDDITVKDIQDAADAFRSVYNTTNGLDGYVSLEVNPKLAHSTEQTIAEGKRLHGKVNRPNVMFKVPSTDAGFPAIAALLAEGINVNVTLIFSVQQYVNTAEAYLQGVENLLQRSGDVGRIRSVASVFVSRVDTLVDKMIDEALQRYSEVNIQQKLQNLKGEAAAANSALIYAKYRETFDTKRFANLNKKGIGIQRVLWGSTSTKNPAYSDTKYVTELIGKDTVNTLPEQTLNAFLEHGVVAEALPADIGKARVTIEELKGFGIDIDDVCTKLLQDGVIAFEKSFDSLLKSVEEKASKL
jgi:transaldolase